MSGSTVIPACGRAGEGVVTLRNSGSAPLTWSATSDLDGLTFESNGTVPAGGTADIRISSGPRDPGPALQGTITFTTNGPNHPKHTQHIKIQRTGSRFSVDHTLLDFGVMPVNAAAPKQPIVVTNEGNERATLKLDPGEGFTLDGLPQLDPGKSATVNVTFTPTKVGSFSSSPTLDADNYCGDPSTIALKGVGSDGVVGVSPGTIDLGLLACGTKPSASKKLTVINTSKQPFHAFFLFASTTYSKGKIFEGAPDAFMVPGESQEDIDIDALQGVPQSAPIIQGYWHDTLTLTTDAPKDKPHDIQVLGTPAGGVLVASPGSWDFGKRKVLDVATYDFSVDNYGNQSVTLSLSPNAPFSTASSITVTPGQTSKLTITHTARPDDLAITLDQAIGWSTNDPICAPLPSEVHAKVYTFEKATAAAPRRSNSGNDPHSCAAAASGHAYCWGRNFNGQIGNAKAPNIVSVPTVVDSLSTVESIGVGSRFTCALDANHVPWCWGFGAGGQLGNGGTGDSNTPVQVSGISDAVSLAVGNAHACVLRMNGDVACWGGGAYGVIGNGSPFSSTTPKTVSNLNDAVAIAAGNSLTCAARATGALVCWGEDTWSQFGGSGMSNANQPVTITGVSTAVKVGVNQGFCFLDANGQGACFGRFWTNNVNSTSTTAMAMPFNFKAKAIAMGSSLSTWCPTAVFNGSDYAYCWGYDGSGEVGDGMSSLGWQVPIKSFSDPISFLGVGDALVMAVRASDGSLWQWGKPDQTIIGPTKVVGFDP